MFWLKRYSLQRNQEEELILNNSPKKSRINCYYSTKYMSKFGATFILLFKYIAQVLSCGTHKHVLTCSKPLKYEIARITMFLQPISVQSDYTNNHVSTAIRRCLSLTFEHNIWAYWLHQLPAANLQFAFLLRLKR